MCPVKIMATFKYFKYKIFHAISQDTILKQAGKADSQSCNDWYTMVLLGQPWTQDLVSPLQNIYKLSFLYITKMFFFGLVLQSMEM